MTISSQTASHKIGATFGVGWRSVVGVWAFGMAIKMPVLDLEVSRVPAMAYDGFEERLFLLFWEVTRACALACKHCRAETQSHRHPQELNREESSRLIGQLAELRPPMLILTGGDPLMRTDALDLVREAAAGLHVGLSPSATARLIHADFAEIKAAGVERISLSLDGATRATHDAFRGVSGTFDRTIAALHRAHAADLSVQINTTLTRGNLSEYEAFKKLMFELKPAIWSVFLLVQSLGARAGKHRPGMRSPLGIRDGREVMFISHTGVVSLSGFLPFDCGNVREEHPTEIYRHHPLFVSLRDNQALGGKCGRCEFNSCCGGSRARAYGVIGDPFAEDPACVYQPKVAAASYKALV
jgi:MoaA/NifB/PqqE/SkfB family radical SAM enzyme